MFLSLLGICEVKVSESHSVMSNSWDPMDCIVHGNFQARILEWAAVPFSRGSFQPREDLKKLKLRGIF